MFWIILALLIVITLTLIFFSLVKRLVILVLNSLIGLFALMGFNLLFSQAIPINFWTVLLTAIGGIIGFTIVLVAHFLGIAF
jgi:hypothetical protein